MHLGQPGFTYNACGPFTKNKERIRKFKETGDSRYIYQYELDKACFQHDITYGSFKGLTRRTAGDKVFHDKAFNIAKNSKQDTNMDLLQWSIHFLIQWLPMEELKMKLYLIKNQQNNYTNQLLENLMKKK